MYLTGNIVVTLRLKFDQDAWQLNRGA